MKTFLRTACRRVARAQPTKSEDVFGTGMINAGTKLGPYEVMGPLGAPIKPRSWDATEAGTVSTPTSSQRKILPRLHRRPT